MSSKLTLLIIITFILSSLLVSQDYWPQYFSHQDKINPQTINQNQPTKHIAIFNNQIIPYPTPLAEPIVLGQQDSQPPATINKKIEVDLTNQRLYAWENDQIIHNFIISSGTWDRTPTGEFHIWSKIRSQKMSGGSKELGTYYYLPNVPYILFFYNNQIPKNLGYSLHGTYWHENFGVPMSHGCINMRTPDVAQIFEWADYTTPIFIHGKYQTVLPQAFKP